jgi:hypothetical protein
MYVQNRNKSLHEKVKIYCRLTEGLHRFRIKKKHSFSFFLLFCKFTLFSPLPLPPSVPPSSYIGELS